MLRRFVLLCLLYLAVAGAAHAQNSLHVDARDIARGLITAHMEFQAPPADLTLYYPKWIQGTHAPGGPVENLGGLRFFDDAGNALEWERDPLDVFTFHVKAPAGAKAVKCELTYLCNQASVNSEGVDSYGNSSLGVVNWNTCLLYPSGAKTDEIQVSASIAIPEGWKLSCPLPREGEGEGIIRFKPASLTQVVDSPAIFSSNFRSIPLPGAGMPPVKLDVVSESAGALQIPQRLIDQYTNVVTEAGLIFGGAPFDDYTFLLTCSNAIGGNGLEHGRSSFNGVGERDLLDEKKLRGWVGYLLPHEFVHAWCGKYRRPVGMTVADFQQPLDTGMLWVYEGLTEYLGLVLCARSGMWTPDHYREVLAQTLTWLMQRKGRDWRDLEDTAKASWTIRASSPAWNMMRRGQDYYDEGALWWMEADAIIRLESDGQRSLDDFCKAFFGPQHGATPVIPYQREEMLAALHQVQEFDWEKFFDERVNKTHADLPAEFAQRLGYRLQSTPTQPAAQREDEEENNYILELHSIGAVFGNDGVVRSNLVPGMSAEKAGLAPKMKVVAVNSKAFTKERLRDAIAESTASRKIELLVLDGDTYTTKTLDYADGLKYLELARDGDRPDVLNAIIKQRREEKK